MEYLRQTRTTILSNDEILRQRTLWTPPENGIVDGMTVCPRCESKKVSHVDKQLRSGDEGMTVLARCASCGHRWTLR